MNIQILDSWLREHLKTKATPQEIAEKLSLTSVGIERIYKHGSDFIYDIEVTTNRPDLASVVGLAREAAAVLPQHGIEATFIPPQLLPPVKTAHKEKVQITMENDPSLIHRICAVVLDVKIKPSPKVIQERLETSDIRSLNNVIDVTNYVMREIGHPTHVFDFDRLHQHLLKIQRSQPGDIITTLDGKAYTLPGDDIVAVDGSGKMVDLIGIMGLENSVVTDTTKRILYFIDNNDVNHIRETSMKLGIRTEAAQLNEKGIDPELAYDAMLYGIQLFKDIADATIISDIIDIYPEKNELHKTAVSNLKVQQYLGVPLPVTRSAEILRTLGFQVTVDGEMITAVVPSFRSRDVSLPEDLIEEIARVYGYHNIPNRLPPLQPEAVPTEQNYFYWEKRVKDALKYWGFTEVYTYSMIPEDMYEGSLEEAVTIENPLSEEFVYMRTSLIMSLLKVLEENKARDRISVFEIANVYYRRDRDLPQEIRFFSGVIKKPGVSFFEVKGIIEQLAYDLGIDTLTFKGIEHGSIGAEIYLRHEKIGEIEILDHNIIDFELNFDLLLQHATLKKTYTPLAKYPPVIEDMAFILDEIVLTEDVIKTIAEQSMLIVDVSLLDRYQDSRTFHIVYQDREKNLKTDDIAPIRAKISQILQKKFNAKAKM